MLLSLEGPVVGRLLCKLSDVMPDEFPSGPDGLQNLHYYQSRQLQLIESG